MCSSFISVFVTSVMFGVLFVTLCLCWCYALVCCLMMTSLLSIAYSKVPTAVPENVHIASRTTTTLTYAWNEITCGFRGGSIAYKYTLDTSPAQSGDTTDTGITLSELTACRVYEFKVQASNSAGESANVSETGETDVESK